MNFVTNTSPELRHWWHPVARSAEVGSEPLRVMLLGVPWMVARSDDGLMAMVDACPHRRAPLSAGRLVGNNIQCPYHGWQFGRDGRCSLVPALGTSGRVPPSAKASAAWGVTERHGLVWIAPAEPRAEIIDLPFWEDPHRSKVDMEIYEGRYGAALLIDNQIDMGHFSFIHANTFGSPDGQVLPESEMERERWGFTARARIDITAANDPAAAAGERPIHQYRNMVYRYRAPFSLELRIDYPVMGGSMVIAFFAQPQTEDSCRFYATLSFDQPGGFSEKELADRVGFEYRVVAEDMDLQARFDDIRLPLDPGAEVSTKADKPSIEYRRVLREVLAAGVEPELPAFQA